MNKDGTWVRLSAESVNAYADGCPDVAWCLQYHRHLDKVLLIPIEENSPTVVRIIYYLLFTECRIMHSYYT